MLILKNSLLWVLRLLVCLIMVGCSRAVVNEPVAPESSGPVEAALPAQPVTWGPSSYGYDTITLVAILAEEERNRAEKTLRGLSSSGYDTITLVAILAAEEQNQAEQTLKGLAEGPSHRQ